MANKEKKTGLGTGAFWQAGPRAPLPDEEGAPPVASETTPAVSEKMDKVRPTITLYPSTLATLELLKVHARRGGKKATYSDIFEEALSDLAAKWNVRLDER